MTKKTSQRSLINERSPRSGRPKSASGLRRIVGLIRLSGWQT